jgi:predicted CopG family antitoxin
MGTADDQIRVSDRVKDRLDRRRREGESYNDVLERLLIANTDADFDDGFGTLSGDQGDWIQKKRDESSDERKRRMQRLEDA